MLTQLREWQRRARLHSPPDDSRIDRADGNAEAGQVLHTEKLLLVDEGGHLRGVYNGTLPHDVNRLVEDVRALSTTSSK